MRLLIVCLFLGLSTRLPAQLAVPVGAGFLPYQTSLSASESRPHSKWQLSRYTAIGSSYLFFKGGHAFQLSAPVGLQATRQLSPQLYAFANAAITPTYTTFNRTFLTTDLNKNLPGHPWQQNAYTGLYPSLALGLQYVNEERTFSISGSVRVERNDYSGVLPYSGLPAAVEPARRPAAH